MALLCRKGKNRSTDNFGVVVCQQLRRKPFVGMSPVQLYDSVLCAKSGMSWLPKLTGINDTGEVGALVFAGGINRRPVEAL